MSLRQDPSYLIELREKSRSIERPSRKQQINIQMKSLKKMQQYHLKKFRQIRNHPFEALRDKQDPDDDKPSSYYGSSSMKSSMPVMTKEHPYATEPKRWQPDLSTDNVFEDQGVEESADQKYLKFKLKIKKQVEEANLVSESEDSYSDNEELTHGVDENREEDLKNFKKSQKAQREGTVNLIEIALRQ
jgi:hypothetical protein